MESEWCYWPRHRGVGIYGLIQAVSSKDALLRRQLLLCKVFVASGFFYFFIFVRRGFPPCPGLKGIAATRFINDNTDHSRKHSRSLAGGPLPALWAMEGQGIMLAEWNGSWGIYRVDYTWKGNPLLCLFLGNKCWALFRVVLSWTSSLKLKAEPNSCHPLKVLQRSPTHLIGEVKETQAVYLL